MGAQGVLYLTHSTLLSPHWRGFSRTHPTQLAGWSETGGPHARPHGAQTSRRIATMADPVTGPETRAPVAPDPFNQIYQVNVQDGKATPLEPKPLPDSAHQHEDLERLPPQPELPALHRIQPALAA